MLQVKSESAKFQIETFRNSAYLRQLLKLNPACSGSGANTLFILIDLSLEKQLETVENYLVYLFCSRMIFVNEVDIARLKLTGQCFSFGVPRKV